MAKESEIMIGSIPQTFRQKEGFLSRWLSRRRENADRLNFREEVIGKRYENSDGAEENPFHVDEIRQVIRTDIKYILEWLSDPDTRTHLSPLDEVKKIPENEADRMDAIAHLADYYFVNKGKPEKITPLVATNKRGQPLGAVTMRWSEDPYIGVMTRVAGLERLVVAPEARKHGVGTTLINNALGMAFSEGEGAPYRGKGANEVRLWVMTRTEGGIPVPNWHKNIQFFESFGFGLVTGAPEWEAYAQKKNLPYNPGEQAYWMRLPRENYRPLEKP